MRHVRVNRLDDIDLGAAISAALHSSANRWPIIVGVSHGIVTLEGDVDTPERRDAIESVVRGFAGVRKVVNSVTVRAVSEGSAESRGGRRVSGSPQ